MENIIEILAKKDKQIELLTQKNAELSQQMLWFQRQLFGRKSEKRFLNSASLGHTQLELDLKIGELIEPEVTPIEKTQTIATHTRRAKIKNSNDVLDQGLRFDESVPVEVIEITPPEFKENPEEFEVIGEKITHRLAQRPATPVILKYVRLIVKKKETAEILNTPAPTGVLEHAGVDVSFLAVMLIDKFLYHLPIYRQHQRLLQAKVTLSRSILTTWLNQSAQLLKPIHEALSHSILQSNVLAMDETPIKVGCDTQKKQMKTGWLWPMYGDQEEVAFSFSPSRGAEHLKNLLANFNGTLLTDGYAGYTAFIKSLAQQEKSQSVVHAQCWAHTRRMFEKAQIAHAKAANTALDFIGKLYGIEKNIRAEKRVGADKLNVRQEKSKPISEQFFAWCHTQSLSTPTDVFAKAIQYAVTRKENLSIYLSDPDVAIDTNHVERNLRAIPMGKKNWLFCWTEVGAETLAIVQSLLVSCRLQQVDPYVYLVDVLQRVAIHPNSRIDELIPRNWKERFAENPLISDLDALRKNSAV